MHLIYVSSATQQLRDNELHELTAILDSSVRHNLPNNITGMLLYADGNFIQVIEGEPEAINETFQRIYQDPNQPLF